MARKQFIGLKVTEEERKTLEKLAGLKRQSMSKVVRDAFLSAAADLGLRAGGGQQAESEVRGETQ